MTTTEPSAMPQNRRSQNDTLLCGLIVATKKTDDGKQIPCALLRVGGITLLERQARQLRNIGVKEIVVFSSENDARLLVEIKRLTHLKMQIVLHFSGQDQTNARPFSSGSDWMLMDGSALIDFRLPGAIAAQASEQVAVVPDVDIVNKDSMRGIRLEVYGKPVIFAGCARISSQRLNEQNIETDDNWPGNLLSAMIQDGTVSPVDITTMDSYMLDMRRDLPFYWVPIRSSSDSRRGKEFLIAAAQKGVLDWPAYYIHRPIENWIVRYICEWPITPNQITLICNVIAYFAAYHFAVGSLWWALLGALIVGVLDGVDGKQARVKQMMSRIGGIIEHVCDSIYEYVWQFAIAYRLSTEGHGTTPYLITLFILGVDMAEKVLLNLFERKRGVSLNDYSAFDRFFRVIVGRRNNYMWTLIPFVALDALWIGYWALGIYALITLLERMWRVGFILLFRPEPVLERTAHN